MNFGKHSGIVHGNCFQYNVLIARAGIGIREKCLVIWMSFH